MITYKIETTRSDANAPEGRSVVVWLARAPDHWSAIRMVAGKNPSIVDEGSHLDAEAVSLGVRDGDAKQAG